MYEVKLDFLPTQLIDESDGHGNRVVRFFLDDEDVPRFVHTMLVKLQTIVEEENPFTVGDEQMKLVEHLLNARTVLEDSFPDEYLDL